MYLGVRLWMSDGGQISSAVGPFPDQGKDMREWGSELHRLIMENARVKGVECVAIGRISRGIPSCMLSPGDFLEWILGVYQDSQIESLCLLRFGRRFGVDESGT
ncbi:hypothetical protein IT398_00695 [Candidatus Nomurabacteria bacterium]|nr:hypothetical protein [Candidatus Nomurabacteria bacterium]